MKKRVISSLGIAFCMFVSFTAFGLRQSTSDDKITVWKGKDSSMIDKDMNFCKGSGAKCAELTTNDLKEIIKALKE